MRNQKEIENRDFNQLLLKMKSQQILKAEIPIKQSKPQDDKIPDEDMY